jgi:hypothetical protein
MSKNNSLSVEILQVDDGSFFWICTCSSCGGPTDDNRVIDLDARYAHGPFKNYKEARRDIRALVAGRITKATKEWRAVYLDAFFAEHPELLLTAAQPAGRA